MVVVHTFNHSTQRWITEFKTHSTEWVSKTVHSSLVKGGSPWIPPHSVLECWLARSCRDHVQASTAAVESRVQQSVVSGTHRFTVVLPMPWILGSFQSLLRDGPWAVGRGVIQMAHVWLSTPTHSLHSDWLWVSLLTVIHCTKNHLWENLRFALI